MTSLLMSSVGRGVSTIMSSSGWGGGVHNIVIILEGGVVSTTLSSSEGGGGCPQHCLTVSSKQNLCASRLSARILHRAPPPPRLQVDQNFLTQKIVADQKMRCHQKSFGIWSVTEAILGQKTCFF